MNVDTAWDDGLSMLPPHHMTSRQRDASSGPMSNAAGYVSGMWRRLGHDG